LPWRASVLIATIVALLLAACGGAASRPAASPSVTGLIQGSSTVSVMYAGSLVSLFEKKVGPGFQTATGFTYQGEGKGSVAIANNIKDKVRTPDIFVSADPTVNKSLQGAANGNYVSWWVNFARTEMVIAWSPESRFASDFQAGKSGKKPWESVLQEPGLKLGRTDPELDPKGYRTLFMFQLDEQQKAAESGLTQRVLGPPSNPSQIFPEEQLVARLQAGELDAGFFYTIEAVEANLPYLALPTSINQGDPGQSSHYASASYTNKKGQVFQGSPILYTVTVPGTVKNEQGAESFVQYLLSKDGQALLAKEGLLSTPPVVDGNMTAVPAAINPYVRA
jgi:molybdate/tungstate transport system substrate-binding protein